MIDPFLLNMLLILVCWLIGYAMILYLYRKRMKRISKLEQQLEALKKELRSE